MPRGVPTAGFRKTKKYQERTAVAPAPVVHETDEQISAKIEERFAVLAELAESALRNEIRSMIVSGPAGVGKSYTLEQKLKELDPDNARHTYVKGYMRATGLYRVLYERRGPDQIVVFDDADKIFFEQTSLNILKAVTDTTEDRIVSYGSEYEMFDDDGEKLPKNFKFEGTAIFLTNYDFDALIEKDNEISKHIAAMVSRSHYIDLAMENARYYMVRIKQVIGLGMLRNMGLDAQQEQEVMEYMDENRDNLRELSLRMALKLGGLRKNKPATWKAMAKITCCKKR